MATTFDYSKSMGGKSSPKKPGAKTSTTPPPDSFSFPSMGPVMAQRKAAEQRRINRIMSPDLSHRLRFPSLGDPPRPEPKRSDFQDKPGLSFPSMKSDNRASERYQAAHKTWDQEQEDEGRVMKKTLLTSGVN